MTGHQDAQFDRWIGAQKESSAAVDLSVVIPAFNERWRLPPTLIDVIDYFDAQPLSYELIVVDDGSRDETAEVVRKFERVRAQVRLISLPKNMGKGHAIRVGVLNSRGERVLMFDADGATPIAELERLMPALDQGADVAIGSRAMASETTAITARWHRKYIGRVFNSVVSTVVLPGFHDTQCGFKLFSRRAAEFLFRRQTSDGFSFDVEILFMAKKVGFEVREIPVNWHNVTGSKVNLLLDSARMFRDLFRFRMLHRSLSPSDLAPR